MAFPLAPYYVYPELGDAINAVQVTLYNRTGCHVLQEVVLRRGFCKKHNLTPGSYMLASPVGLVKITVPEPPPRPWQEVIRETG